MTRLLGYAFAGTTMTVLVPGHETSGAFTVLHVIKPSGSSTPPHLHERDAEIVYVLSGQAKAEAEGRVQVVSEGDMTVLPPGRPHRLFNDSGQVTREFLLCVPAGFDAFVAEAGRPTEPFVAPIAMTDTDRQRLIEAAPRHGIRLLRSAEPETPVGESGRPLVEMWDVCGVRVELLARLGVADADLVLLRSSVPAGATIPLHGLADPGCVFVIDGHLEIFTRTAAPGWTSVGPDQAAYLAPAVRHAWRNVAGVPATILIVTTVRMARFLKEIDQSRQIDGGNSPKESGWGAFLRQAQAHGIYAAPPTENADIGSSILTGSSDDLTRGDA